MFVNFATVVKVCFCTTFLAQQFFHFFHRFLFLFFSNFNESPCLLINCSFGLKMVSFHAFSNGQFLFSIIFSFLQAHTTGLCLFSNNLCLCKYTVQLFCFSFASTARQTLFILISIFFFSFRLAVEGFLKPMVLSCVIWEQMQCLLLFSES